MKLRVFYFQQINFWFGYGENFQPSISQFKLFCRILFGQVFFNRISLSSNLFIRIFFRRIFIVTNIFDQFFLVEYCLSNSFWFDPFGPLFLVEYSYVKYCQSNTSFYRKFQSKSFLVEYFNRIFLVELFFIKQFLAEYYLSYILLVENVLG